MRFAPLLAALSLACTDGGEVVGIPTGATWQWQLQGDVDTSFDVDVYDVDLFDADPAVITALHDAGRTVICYLSAGTFEPFREDADRYPDELKGNPYDPPFEEELYVDVRDARILEILEARLDRAVETGCDGVEPDNVDLHDQDSGFDVTPDENLAFDRALAAAAHARGLSVGLKNNLSQLDALVGDFDWALNEECFGFDECDSYADNFVAQGKAVLHAEYEGDIAAICATTTPLGLSSILKDIELFAPVTFCP